MKSLPVISLSELEKASEIEIKKLYDVCYEYGFFYLKEHGVSPEVINQTIEASRIFFELPENVKLNYRQDIQTVYPKTSRGYLPLYGELFNKESGFDPKAIFDLGLEKPLSDKPFTDPAIMPEDSIAPRANASNFCPVESDKIKTHLPHFKM
jgi:isopenicillin N synthase-like dioxygenase